MSDGAPFIVLQECGGKLHIRCRRPYPQEFQLRLLEVPVLVAEIVGVLPRDAHSIALIDQIMAAVRAHRPRDRTNAERQRRFRQRRRAEQLRASRTSKEGTPA
jgi:hypothetical protein